MAILFPSGLDNFTNPTPANNLNTPAVLHTDQHSDLNDAVEALEAKVGINGSLVTGTLDFRVVQLESSGGHSPVTLGTANGLSLSGQALSMSLASATATGTLSAADWNTFNNKVPSSRLISTTSPLAGGGDLSANRTLSMPQASGTQSGYLSGADWVAFNSKQSALSFPLAASLGGTGILNSGTFTNHFNSSIVGGGTLNLGNFSIVAPASGTMALLATHNVFTTSQTMNVGTGGLLTVQGSTGANVAAFYSNLGAPTGTNVTKIVAQFSRDAGDDGVGIGYLSRSAGQSYGGSIVGYIASITGSMSDNLFLGTPQRPFAIRITDTGSGSSIYLNPTDPTTNAWASIIFTGIGVLEGVLTDSNANGPIIMNGSTSLGMFTNSASGDLVLVGRGSTTRGLGFATGAAGASLMRGAISPTGFVTFGDDLMTSKVPIRRSTRGILETYRLTATTNAVVEGISLLTESSGSAAAGLGSGLSFYAETATNLTDQQQGLISTSWIDATNASRKAKMSLSVYDTAVRLGIEIEASGAAVKLGFFGVSTVGRPTGTADLRQSLIDLGLYSSGGATPLNLNGGFLKVGGITNDTGLAHGTYIPTGTAAANLDATPTLTEAQYMRVGNTVTVSGRFTADPTLTATPTSFEITLPIASNFGAIEDAAGVSFCGSIVGQGAEVNGVVANDTAKISWVSGDITSQSWSYIFTYQVI